MIIRDAHTNIVFERKNDEVLLDSNNALSGEKKASNEIKYEIKKFTIDDLIDYVNRVPAEELAFIQKGIDMNMKIAKAGLREEDVYKRQGVYNKKNISPVCNPKSMEIIKSDAVKAKAEYLSPFLLPKIIAGVG